MFSYKISFLFIVSVFLFASCSKTINIPLPDEPIKPVLNAFMSQDSLIWATATLSGRFDNFNVDGSNNYPEGVVVKLYEDDQYVETLRDTMIYQKKYYISDRKVTGNKKYRLTLEIKGYEMVEGSNIIPDRNELEILDKATFVVANKYDFYDFNFNFTIRNNGISPRYYKFRIHTFATEYSIDENGDTTFYRNETILNLRSKDAIGGIFSDDYLDPALGGVYAVEPLHPAGQKSYSLEVKDYSAFGSTGGDSANDSFLLEVSVLTNDTYNYLYTYSNISKNEGDPTSEKQNVICNVKNGYGIVGGMASQFVLFKK